MLWVWILRKYVVLDLFVCSMKVFLLQFLVFVPLLCFFFPSNTPILYALLIDFLWLFSIITLLNSFLFVLSFLFDLTIFSPFWTSSFVFIHRYVTSSLSLVYVMIFFLLFLIPLVTWFLIFSNFDLCYSLISCICKKCLGLIFRWLVMVFLCVVVMSFLHAFVVWGQVILQSSFLV